MTGTAPGGYGERTEVRGTELQLVLQRNAARARRGASSRTGRPVGVDGRVYRSQLSHALSGPLSHPTQRVESRHERVKR